MNAINLKLILTLLMSRLDQFKNLLYQAQETKIAFPPHLGEKKSDAVKGLALGPTYPFSLPPHTQPSLRFRGKSFLKDFCRLKGLWMWAWLVCIHQHHGEEDGSREEERNHNRLWHIWAQQRGTSKENVRVKMQGSSRKLFFLKGCTVQCTVYTHITATNV